MDWTVSPLSPNIYFQALTPDVMILGRWDFWEIFKFRYNPEGGALMMELLLSQDKTGNLLPFSLHNI